MEDRKTGDLSHLVALEDAIRSQFATILASKAFREANRSTPFLEFAVTKTLAGAQDSVKSKEPSSPSKYSSRRQSKLV